MSAIELKAPLSGDGVAHVAAPLGTQSRIPLRPAPIRQDGAFQAGNARFGAERRATSNVTSAIADHGDFRRMMEQIGVDGLIRATQAGKR
jgi:hypothetical protein